MNLPVCLGLTGPTGVGKTAYVDAIARAIPVEVVNMDSCQAYAFFRVGTGRADGDDGVARHLFGFLGPHETMSVESYVAKATAVASEIRCRGRVPLFEGGSRSFLPAIAQALPVKFFGLRPPSERQWILDRMRRRAEGFLEDDALIREVQAGLAAGYGECPLMRDPMIYMETRTYLEGHCSREDYIDSMVRSMMDMHSDQLRAFANEDIEWVDVETTGPQRLVELIGAEIHERVHS